MNVIQISRGDAPLQQRPPATAAESFCAGTWALIAEANGPQKEASTAAPESECVVCMYMQYIHECCPQVQVTWVVQ